MIRYGSKDVEDLSSDEKDELLKQLLDVLINDGIDNDVGIGQMLILLEEKQLIQ